MPLTRSFRVTMHARLQRDAAFRRAVLRDALDSLLASDLDTGKSVLRSYVHGTVGFAKLAEITGKSPKSLMRMFGPSGNPQAKNLFEVISFLQQAEGIKLQVRVSKSAA